VSYDPGDLWVPELTVKDDNGTLTDATVVLATTSPSGVAGAPSVSHDSLGRYSAQVLLDEAGRWLATWTVSGAVTGVETQNAYVRRLGSNVISLADVKVRLNKTLTVDDAEIEAMIDAAIAEYEDHVGPVSGTRTDVLDGGGTSLLLSTANPATLVSLTYADGTVVDTADVTLDTTTGLVFWNYGTAGRFSGGSRYVTVQYTVGPVPANHREAIIADVAGYFEATQAGPVGPDEGYGFGSRTTPLVLFPRIRALAVPSIA
jgi:hypothetical protein